MAVVSITIPDVLIPRIRTAARALFPQYAALSDAETFKAITAEQWKSILASYESQVAQAKSQVDAAAIG